MLTFNTGMDATMPRRIPDNPTAAERQKIAQRIRTLPLMRRDALGVLDWPGLAARLAEELAATSQRLAAARDLTDADAERIARAEIVLRDYQTAATAGDCGD